MSAEGASVTASRLPGSVAVDRIFSSRPRQPRVRRATDVLVLAPALLVLGLLIAAQPPGDFERSLQSFLASFPGWFDPVWHFAYAFAALWAVLLLAAVLIGRRR